MEEKHYSLVLVQNYLVDKLVHVVQVDMIKIDNKQPIKIEVFKAVNLHYYLNLVKTKVVGKHKNLITYMNY